MTIEADARDIAELLKLPKGKTDYLRERYGLREWASRHIRLPKGEPLDFRVHPYQKRLYDDLSIEMCALKGAQLGFSTHAIAKAIWVSLELGRNVIYTMPTSSDVSTFTAARINPIIRNSGYMADRIVDINSVKVKQFSTLTKASRQAIGAQATAALAEGDVEKAEQLRSLMSVGTLYFRGTVNETEAAAADSDFNVHDELDRSDPLTREQYEERLSHSDMKWRYDLSTPKFPGQAIDKRWQVSDKHVWMVRCPRCRHQFELRFPGQPVTEGEEAYANLSIDDPDLWREGDSEVEYVCHRCGRIIDNRARLNGEWVPLLPGRPVRGYRISQMSYVGTSATQIMTKYVRSHWKANFWNLVMAAPYADRSENLSREVILKAMEPPLGGYVMQPVNIGGMSTMGIDVGKVHNVVIRQPHPDFPGRWKTVWLEQATSWERLDQLMWQFNVWCCVIDALPELSMTVAFAKRHLGRVFRCWFGGDGRAKFDPPMGESNPDAPYKVTIDRTAALDMDRDRYASQLIGMPQMSPEVEVFIRQCEVVYRQPEYQTSEHGQDTTLVKAYRWIETGADHYRLASVYEMVASMRYDPMAQVSAGVTTRLMGAKTKGPE